MRNNHHCKVMLGQASSSTFPCVLLSPFFVVKLSATSNSPLLRVNSPKLGRIFRNSQPVMRGLDLSSLVTHKYPSEMLNAPRGRARLLLALSSSVASLAVTAAILPSAPASATDLASIRAQVTKLQQDATAIAENAQQAQVEMTNLQSKLNSLQGQTSAEQQSLKQVQSTIGAIAREQYMNSCLLYTSDAADE